MQGSKIISVRGVGIRPTFNVTMSGKQHNYAIETHGQRVFTANSHAACYAYIGYQCAWLKYYYKVEFAAALMTTYMGDDVKIDKYERVFTRAGVNVLPHQVNKSKLEYSIEGNSLRRPLKSLKGLGAKAAAAIVAAQPFSDLKDFATKVSGRIVNKSIFETLVSSGAMDCLGMSRPSMLVAYGDAKNAAKEAIKEREAEHKRVNNYGTLDLFGMGEATNNDK